MDSEELWLVTVGIPGRTEKIPVWTAGLDALDAVDRVLTEYTGCYWYSVRWWG